MSVFIFLVLVGAVGCNNDDEETERLRLERAAELAKIEKPEPPPSLYDDEGQLLESTEVNSGLKLPVGMRKARELPRETIYRSKVPTRKLLEYFGPRLTTGLVDASRGGATYRNAKVRGQESKYIRMDVSILPIGKQGNRISIKLLPMQLKSQRPKN